MNNFGEENNKISHVPMTANCKIDSNEDGKDANQKTYISMIGSLFYLMASSSNIMLRVSYESCVEDYQVHQRDI